MTFTAERAAYRCLLNEGSQWFGIGSLPPGFDLALCSDNEYNEWTGAQIRADVYGWVTPGNPALAAELARADAALSHRGDGIHGAVLVAAWGAAIPEAASLSGALDRAVGFIPADSGTAAAIALGRELAESGQGSESIHERYAELSPVHTLNNLAWSSGRCSSTPMILVRRSAKSSQRVVTRTATERRSRSRFRLPIFAPGSLDRVHTERLEDSSPRGSSSATTPSNPREGAPERSDRGRLVISSRLNDFPSLPHSTSPGTRRSNELWRRIDDR
jgi:hypothetical protein